MLDLAEQLAVATGGLHFSSTKPSDDIASGLLGILTSACQSASDCNANSIPDSCEIADGSVADQNLDGVPDECQLVSITSANPPTDNPYAAEQQPFRDVLDTGAGPALTAGIGGNGTASQGSVAYAPISVTFSGAPLAAPTTDNVAIACTSGACPTVAGVTGSGNGPYQITLSAPIPPGQCTTLTFAGTSVGTKLQFQSQPGNINMDATTNTQDLLALIQAINNGQANLTANLARYNINRSTGAGSQVNTQDLLRLIQLLNGVNTTQAFNGAGVAACP